MIWADEEWGMNWLEVSDPENPKSILYHHA